MNDLEFTSRCVKGDKRSWDEFVDKYSRLIYSYIHSVLKVKGFNLAQDNINDLFQGIFLSLISDNFKKLRSFKSRNGCSLASWLRQVAVNHSIDYLRKFRQNISLDKEDEEGFSLKDVLINGSTPAIEIINNSDRLKDLKDCIKKLDSDEKYFLELHINRGLSLEVLKGHLRLSRGAIDMRKSRIIEKLRECFKGKNFALDF